MRCESVRTLDSGDMFCAPAWLCMACQRCKPLPLRRLALARPGPLPGSNSVLRLKGNCTLRVSAKWSG